MRASLFQSGSLLRVVVLILQQSPIRHTPVEMLQEWTGLRPDYLLIVLSPN